MRQIDGAQASFFSNFIIIHVASFIIVIFRTETNKKRNCYGSYPDGTWELYGLMKLRPHNVTSTKYDTMICYLVPSFGRQRNLWPTKVQVESAQQGIFITVPMRPDLEIESNRFQNALKMVDTVTVVSINMFAKRARHTMQSYMDLVAVLFNLS